MGKVFICEIFFNKILGIPQKNTQLIQNLALTLVLLFFYIQHSLQT